MTAATTPAAPLPADQAARNIITGDTARTLFVNAGAGTGKTRSLVERICTLALEDEVPMLRIAAVTFTEKAGAELRDRLRTEFERVWRTSTGRRRELAQHALDELDRAAVGTLHSFARRILTEHAVAAGLPPLVEVTDEVASSVAFDERWSALQTALLDDDAMAGPVLLGMAAGLKLDHVRSLARALDSDWDLVEDRILPTPVPTVSVPDLSGFLRRARDLLATAASCTDDQDRLLAKFPALTTAVNALESAADDGARVHALVQVADMRFGGTGRKGNWTCDIATVRDAGNDLAAAAREIVARLLDGCLRAITRWTARGVLEAAQQRRQEGRLEFHDLLVLARDLLRRDPEVRAALHDTYERLLLDEFQDTDPIQVDLAVRIAGGADADAEDWADVVVPEGRLFFVGDGKQSIYRFRRADVAVYLRAEDRLGTPVSLTTNFRTVEPVLRWVNSVFGRLIQPEEGVQPRYEALTPYRPGKEDGPPVTLLGGTAHPGRPKAAELRTVEAAEVADAIRTMLAEEWQVWDQQTEVWRAVRPADIAVLVPSRTSLPFLLDALDDAGVPHRAEASSLVYQAPEVRALMAAARAVADPGDRLSLVTALRSPLYGCGDDDLWRWRAAGGSFSLWSYRPDGDDGRREDGPVGDALASLQALARRSRWATPAELLEAVIDERRMYEVGAGGRDRRDVWRRLRFVVDQARAWSQTTSGGLRAYLAWAARQGDESARVSESVLPETDVDAVQISTIHAAKGLEYPVVVLSGMSAQPRQPRGVQLLWPREGGYEVRLSSRLETSDFAEALPVDEQMGDAERMRLLYVAATRARDHLVVSLHRAADSKARTSAKLMADAGATDPALTVPLERLRVPEGPPVAGRAEPQIVLPDLEQWSTRVDGARRRAQQDAAVVASGLEGTEPEIVLAGHDDEAGSHKGPRDLVLPPWSKGRYGSAVGRAVHGVLQTVDLSADEPPAGVVEEQCLAEGVTVHVSLVTDLVRSALASPLVRAAALARHWRESYVGTVLDDGTLLEGYVDLLFEDEDGLVVVDYKTDAIPSAALDSRVAYYAPQMRAYAACLQAATGRPVRSELLFLHPDTAAVTRAVSTG
ncbi:MAG: DNA helicase UvrD [Acidobacteria bacterium]|nr:MAG: DNA helicase UvrD [Acidobacteriota bacterium]